MTDEEILAYVDAHYRNSRTYTYEAMKELPSVTLYENGKAYQPGEILSDDGTYITPPLPYGDYLIAETTVPEKKRPVSPFIIHVREDDTDGTKAGDGEGQPLRARVLRDEDVLCNIRIIKTDALTGKPIKTGNAGYVIHDLEGVWKERFFATATVREKTEYLLKYNGLVMEYDRTGKKWRGSYENPFVTQKTEVDGELVLAASTREGLPTGLYELEEVAAPEGYVLQGKEGRIAVGEDGPFYETEETGMWTPVPSRPVTFAVGIGEGHYDLEDDCWWISVYQANEPVIGKISLKATKEIYETDANGNRTGKTLWIPMLEEKFALYAQKEIRTMQGEVVYEKDALVDSFITDSEGTAWTGEIMEETGYPEGLYPGVYRLVWEYEDKDSSAVEKERIIEIKYKDAHTPVIYKDEVFRIPLKREEIKEKPEIIPIINPKTGDDLPIGIAVVTMTLSAGFFLAVSYVRKRRSED